MVELGTPAKLMDERMGHEDGSVQARDASTFRPSRAWAPSANLAIDVPWNVGEAAPVRFRFTALVNDVRIDDVYVDPYGRS